VDSVIKLDCTPIISLFPIAAFLFKFVNLYLFIFAKRAFDALSSFAHGAFLFLAETSKIII
jgi:hypothetical protein